MAYNNNDDYGYGSGRDYYRSRRRRRNPFSDGNLAALGKQYADIPVDSVTKAITGLKENYYRNRDLKDKYDQALAQSIVMEGDEETKQNLISNIKSRVDKFSEKGDAYETGDDFIRSIAKDVTGNSALFQMLENKKIYDEKQKLVDQMSAKGLAPIYLDDPNFRSVGPEGKLNTYDAYVGSTVNRRPMLENFFNNLKANNKSYANQLLDVFTTKGVDQTRIDQVVSGAMPMLQSTKEYQQSLNNEKAKAQYTGVPFDQNAFDAEWFQNLKDVGKEFMYEQKSVNYNTGASRAALGNTNQLPPSNPNLHTLDAGPVGGREEDTGLFWRAGWGAPDDSFNFWSSRGKRNTDYQETDIKSQSFSGNVTDMTNNRDKETKFVDKPNSKNWFGRFTGDIRTVPIVMDPTTSGGALNEETINKAFKDKGSGLKYNNADQTKFANELPHSGNIGGSIIFSGGRYRNYDSLTPSTLTVGQYTLKYILSKDGNPLFVEMEERGVYDTFDDLEGTTHTGQILAQMSPEVLVNYEFDPKWKSLNIDQSGVVDNIDQLDTTISKIQSTRNPVYQEYIEQLYKVKQGANANHGRLSQEDIEYIRWVDNYLMPDVLRQTNPGGQPDPELAKRKKNII